MAKLKTVPKKVDVKTSDKLKKKPLLKKIVKEKPTRKKTTKAVPKTKTEKQNNVRRKKSSSESMDTGSIKSVLENESVYKKEKLTTEEIKNRLRFMSYLRLWSNDTNRIFTRASTKNFNCNKWYPQLSASSPLFLHQIPSQDQLRGKIKASVKNQTLYKAPFYRKPITRGDRLMLSEDQQSNGTHSTVFPKLSTSSLDFEKQSRNSNPYPEVYSSLVKSVSHKKTEKVITKPKQNIPSENSLPAISDNNVKNTKGYNVSSFPIVTTKTKVPEICQRPKPYDKVSYPTVGKKSVSSNLVTEYGHTIDAYLRQLHENNNRRPSLRQPMHSITTNTNSSESNAIYKIKPLVDYKSQKSSQTPSTNNTILSHQGSSLSINNEQLQTEPIDFSVKGEPFKKSSTHNYESIGMNSQNLTKTGMNHETNEFPNNISGDFCNLLQDQLHSKSVKDTFKNKEVFDFVNLSVENPLTPNRFNNHETTDKIPISDVYNAEGDRLNLSTSLKTDTNTNYRQTTGSPSRKLENGMKQNIKNYEPIFDSTLNKVTPESTNSLKDSETQNCKTVAKPTLYSQSKKDENLELRMKSKLDGNKFSNDINSLSSTSNESTSVPADIETSENKKPQTVAEIILGLRSENFKLHGKQKGCKPDVNRLYNDISLLSLILNKSAPKTTKTSGLRCSKTTAKRTVFKRSLDGRFKVEINSETIPIVSKTNQEYSTGEKAILNELEEVKNILTASLFKANSNDQLPITNVEIETLGTSELDRITAIIDKYNCKQESIMRIQPFGKFTEAATVKYYTGKSNVSLIIIECSNLFQFLEGIAANL